MQLAAITNPAIELADDAPAGGCPEFRGTSVAARRCQATFPRSFCTTGPTVWLTSRLSAARSGGRCRWPLTRFKSPIGRWRAGRPELTADCHAFRGTLGAKVLVCKPADPEAKPIERAHDYLERSFLPGRTFTGPTQLDAVTST